MCLVAKAHPGKQAFDATDPRSKRTDTLKSYAFGTGTRYGESSSLIVSLGDPM